MKNNKLQVWLPLLFSLVMIAGMFYGFQLHRQTGTNQSFFKKERRTALQEALDLIRIKYVDSVGIDSLQAGAMQEMMSELDPHSVYIPARDLSEANEDIIGNFEGIGIEFSILEDTINVLYVVPEGPSDRAKLQVGDRIIKVDDSLVANRKLSSDKVKNLIRGKNGSKVNLTIYRNDKSQMVEITRGRIPIPSLDAAYMIDASTGYIKLNKFAETTHEEFSQALEELQQQGLKKLVLDLRGNGGGLLNEAIDIADDFLDDNKLIVYTEGVNVPKREYRARRDGLFETGGLVLLVDELTASASEILAGALQDWERATIIGRRTFGKGLVQEQYVLSDGSALRLTVARYFTPLGRSIQRPYEKGSKVYMEELYDRYQNGQLVYADSNKYTNGKEYLTRHGHKVYGGGGIMPDDFVSIDTSRLQTSVTKLYLDGTFNNFVYTYYSRQVPFFSQYKTPNDFAKRYQSLDDAWDKLVAYAKKDSINLTKISPTDQVAIRQRMKAYLARFRWRNQGFYEVLNANDKMVEKAMEVLSKPQKN